MKNQLFLEKVEAEKELKLNSVKDIYSYIDSIFKINPELEREVQIQLSSVVSQLYHAALNNTEGYCYKFNLPIVPVMSIFKKINLLPTTVEEIFRKDWKYPKNTRMYSD